MTEISLSPKEYKTMILKMDYVFYSEVLNNIQKQILRLSDNAIISMTERNIYFKLLNEIIRLMKLEYDDYVDHINGLTNNKIICDFTKKIKTTKNITDKKIRKENKHMIYLYKTRKIKDKKDAELFFDKLPFENLRLDILELSSKIGFFTLRDALDVILGEYFDETIDTDTLKIIHDLNSLFIPLEYCNKIEKRNKEIKQNLDDEYKEDAELIKSIDNENEQQTIKDFIKPDVNYNEDMGDNVFTIKKKISKNDALLDNYLEFRLKTLNEGQCILRGYVDFDNLNIVSRTAHLCSEYIMKKKEEKEKVMENESLNDKFSKQYMKYCPMYDIIGLNDNEFAEKIKDDYMKYRDVIKYTNVNTIKNFVKSDMTTMFNMIKLLLIGGSDANIRGAGLVFQLSKDRKIEGQIASNVFYRNLSHFHQNKLRKSHQTLQEELKKIRKLTIDDIDLKGQVSMCANMPLVVKKVALDKIEEMKSSNNEYYKQLLYVRTLLGFPWTSDEDDVFFKNMSSNLKESGKFLDDLMTKLNKTVYGHKECKEEIQRMVAKWISNPATSGNAIGLEGPPGVGKTLIANGLGEALGIPCVKISLGGQNDGEILIGHGYTYSGAQPGLVVKKMVEAGASRCIMYFDELDKACEKNGNNEIFNILIHMTDPNMNCEFQDRFFQEISFPLNKVIFVFSYNDRSLVDRILLDRLKKLEVKPYSLTDKINIARDFLMNECFKEYSYEVGSVKISDDDLKYLIEEYIREAGVRELKRKLENIFGKLNFDRIKKNGIFKKRSQDITAKNPVKITRKLITEYLGEPLHEDDKIHSVDAVGVVNGLYATAIGTGGIVPIQIVNNKTGTEDKFNFILTGSQGKIMKESIHVACSIALEYVSQKRRDEFLSKHCYGFHIHTPSGATPKDGPSAGCAFATAFVSRILNKKIKHDVGMTGEIDLMARVTKIGGLVYKITGARKAGIKKVLVSIENKKDVEDIHKNHKELLEGDFEIKFVDKLGDVLREIIVDFSEDDIVHGDFILKEHHDATFNSNNSSNNKSIDEKHDNNKPKRKYVKKTK
jgi:endopeptidase La